MIKLKEMISEYQYQQGKNNRFPEEIYYDDVREALTKIISTHPFLNHISRHINMRNI